MKTLLAVAGLLLVLGEPALAQTSSSTTTTTTTTTDSRFPQDAVQGGRRRQVTRAEIEQRAATPGSPLAGKPLLDTSKDADRTTDRLYEESLKNSKGVTPDDPSARPPVGAR
jgi:hypothetical protein